MWMVLDRAARVVNRVRKNIRVLKVPLYLAGGSLPGDIQEELALRNGMNKYKMALYSVGVTCAKGTLTMLAADQSWFDNFDPGDHGWWARTGFNVGGFLFGAGKIYAYAEMAEASIRTLYMARQEKPIGLLVMCETPYRLARIVPGFRRRVDELKEKGKRLDSYLNSESEN